MPTTAKATTTRKKVSKIESFDESVTPVTSPKYSLLGIFLASIVGFLTSVQFSIIIGSLLISISILASGGLIRSRVLGVTTPAPNVPAAGDTAAAPTPEPTGPVKVSMDDDPVIGDKNAPLTMVEFSDYECPFCKRYFDETYPDLKKEYIDTGKLKVVYRDFPLSFHQNAPKEAQAANCVREQGGDEVYFKYHDEMFTKTTSNGTGLSLDQLPILAGDLGINVDQFKACLDGGGQKSEVDKDIADGGKVGVSGTPTFFIGKSDSSGTITGTKIVGAQPYATFKQTIDDALSK